MGCERDALKIGRASVLFNDCTPDSLRVFTAFDENGSISCFCVLIETKVSFLTSVSFSTVSFFDFKLLTTPFFGIYVMLCFVEWSVVFVFLVVIIVLWCYSLNF